MNPRFPPHQCSLCYRPVLGLVGQETTLPTYAVPEDKLEEILDAQVIDHVHATCLVESGYAAWWTKALSTLHSRNDDTTLLFESPQLILQHHRNTNDVIVTKDGLQVRFAPDDLCLLDEGLMASVAIKREYSLQLPDKSALLREVAARLEKDHSFPLMPIVDAFEIEDRLIDVPALENGSVKPLERDPTETTSGFADGWLVVTACHEFRFPGAAAADVPGLAG